MPIHSFAHQNGLLFDKFQNILTHIPFSYANDLSVADEVLIQENIDLTPKKVINVRNLNLQGKHCSACSFLFHKEL